MTATEDMGTASLKQIRLFACGGLLQREIGERCGLTASRVSVIEGDPFNVKFSILQQVVQAMGAQVRIVVTVGDAEWELTAGRP